VPEGDTIFRAARTLQKALGGKTVTRFESAYPALNRIHEDTPITGARSKIRYCQDSEEYLPPDA
jgi:hypothetical protein